MEHKIAEVDSAFRDALRSYLESSLKSIREYLDDPDIPRCGVWDVQTKPIPENMCSCGEGESFCTICDSFLNYGFEEMVYCAIKKHYPGKCAYLSDVFGCCDDEWYSGEYADGGIIGDGNEGDQEGLPCVADAAILAHFHDISLSVARDLVEAEAKSVEDEKMASAKKLVGDLYAEGLRKAQKIVDEYTYSVMASKGEWHEERCYASSSIRQRITDELIRHTESQETSDEI